MGCEARAKRQPEEGGRDGDVGFGILGSKEVEKGLLYAWDRQLLRHLHMRQSFSFSSKEAEEHGQKGKEHARLAQGPQKTARGRGKQGCSLKRPILAIW